MIPAGADGVPSIFGYPRTILDNLSVAVYNNRLKYGNKIYLGRFLVSAKQDILFVARGNPGKGIGV